MDIEDPMKQAQAIADETEEAILALLQAANVEKRWLSSIFPISSHSFCSKVGPNRFRRWTHWYNVNAGLAQTYADAK